VKVTSASADPAQSFTRSYAYDGEEILLEYNGSASILARYTHSRLRTDDILAVDIQGAGVTAHLAQSAGTFAYLKNGQGTVTDIVDTSGNMIQHYKRIKSIANKERHHI